MTLGKRIADLRKQAGLTQEALARQLDLTNQAVSKWESDICCPDISLLPRLADLLGVSIDALFGRETPSGTELPWADDGVLRAVLFAGHQLIDGHPAAERIEFQYEGPALNVESRFSLVCDQVAGNAVAGANITCDCVSGDVRAGRDVTCDEVCGNVWAGRDVHCDEAFGSVQAGSCVFCDHMEQS